MGRSAYLNVEPRVASVATSSTTGASSNVAWHKLRPSVCSWRIPQGSAPTRATIHPYPMLRMGVPLNSRVEATTPANLVSLDTSTINGRVLVTQSGTTLALFAIDAEKSGTYNASLSLILKPSNGAVGTDTTVGHTLNITTPTGRFVARCSSSATLARSTRPYAPRTRRWICWCRSFPSAPRSSSTRPRETMLRVLYCLRAVWVAFGIKRATVVHRCWRSRRDCLTQRVNGASASSGTCRVERVGWAAGTDRGMSGSRLVMVRPSILPPSAAYSLFPLFGATVGGEIVSTTGRSDMWLRENHLSTG